MFNKNYYIVFMTIILTGTVVAISSNSWFTCWLGLEINLMSITPLLLIKYNTTSTESAIKYFISQVIASILIIVFSCVNFYSSYFFLQSFNSLIFMALAIKSGMAPFHFWFPQIMKMMNWMMCFVLIVWQKIAPFVLMSYFNSKFLTIFFMVFSSVVGSLGGLNQINLKLILTYSSIIHSSWMIMLLSINLNYWANYFMIYSLITSSMIMISYFMNFTKMSDIFMSFKNKTMKVFFCLNMMSMGGLPPFVGFYAKMTAIFISLEFFPLWIIFLLVFMSLISLFYYLKLIYNFAMNFSSQKILFMNNFGLTKVMNILIFSVMMNLLISTLIQLL